MQEFILKPRTLTLNQIRRFLYEPITVKLSQDCHAQIKASVDCVKRVIKDGTVYGINTGFGALAHKKIADDQLSQLQTSLVLSHAAGTGDYLANDIVRLMMLFKINSLAAGHSGIRLQVIENLLTLLNNNCIPCVPGQGSVGASGDLAPLAHMSAPLLGHGELFYQDKIYPAKEALNKIGLQPITLGPKEGLALLNGTQASTAIAIYNLFFAQDNFATALITGALTTDAVKGSDAPFDERIHQLRGHTTQQRVALVLKKLLAGSEIRDSHSSCDKVQDPYSLRCQPQVMGAALAQLDFIAQQLEVEANGVTDNPLVFSEHNEILSGGNFHAEPVAFAADNMALAIAEMGSLSERRIAMLTDPHFNTELPAFIVEEPGVNSGFMLAHVTAAALVSENKMLSHPASVDSIPTSANQEDHVSMATHAARRLTQMNTNTRSILAIELLAGCQGLDFRKPLTTSPILQRVFDNVRQVVPYYDRDRLMSKDIDAAKNILNDGIIQQSVISEMFS